MNWLQEELLMSSRKSYSRGNRFEDIVNSRPYIQTEVGYIGHKVTPRLAHQLKINLWTVILNKLILIPFGSSEPKHILLNEIKRLRIEGSWYVIVQE